MVSPAMDAARLTNEQVAYAEGCWATYDAANILAAPGTAAPGVHTMFCPTGMTLIQTLTNLALTTVATASLLAEGKTMVPLIASIASYGINQGFHVRAVSQGPIGFLARCWMGVAFGQYQFVLHTDGGADLYRNDSGTWNRVRQFGIFPDIHGTSSLMSAGPAPVSAIDLFIIPFGRGNILFQMKSGGKVFSDIYSPPASHVSWNSTTNQYDITTAGQVIIYADGNSKSAINLGLAKVTYPTTGTFDDIDYTMHYSPASSSGAPTLNTLWTKTQGTPGMTATVLDPSGATFAPDGTKRDMHVHFALTGDGTNTPWVDGYHLLYDPTYLEHTPTKTMIPQNKIMDLQISDGDNWDDQKLEVTIMDDFTNDDISALSERGRVYARLLIDGDPYGEYCLSRPETTINPKYNLIKFRGPNLGVFRVTKRKFFLNAPSFGNMLQQEAVTSCLNLCGFSSDHVQATTDTVKLPETAIAGATTDKGDTEFKSQPKCNSSVREFLFYIRDNFSDQWKLRYGADRNWVYAPRS